MRCWTADTTTRLPPAILRALAALAPGDDLAARLTEGTITAETDGATSVDAMTRHLRRLLGPAVLGPVPTATEYMTVTLEDATAAEAVRAGPAEPLVAAALTSSFDQLVVVCPARWRSDVTRLLRPLADVAVVVAGDEVATVARLPNTKWCRPAI
jgi:hypothetical protein